MLRRFTLALLPLVSLVSVASADDVVSLKGDQANRANTALASIFDEDLPDQAKPGEGPELEEADEACWRFRRFFGYRCYRPRIYGYGCYRPVCGFRSYGYGYGYGYGSCWNRTFYPRYYW